MHIIKILTIIYLVSSVYSQETENTLLTCIETCSTQADCENNDICQSTFQDFGIQIYSFEIQGCIDFLYTISDDQSTQSEIKDDYVVCLRGFADILEDSTEETYIDCMADCFDEDQEFFEWTEQNSSSQYEICSLECFQTTENCHIQSECLEDVIFNPKTMISLTVKYDIQSCDELNAKMDNDNLSSTEFSSLIIECYDQLSEKIATELTLDSESYPSEAPQVYSCLSTCATDYEIDFSRSKKYDSEDKEDGYDKSEEDREMTECEEGYCMYEFHKCTEQCDIQCGDSCYGDLDYLSFLSSQECKDYMLEVVGKWDSKDSSFNAEIKSTFIECVNSFQELYSENSQLQDHLSCIEQCKDEPEYDNDDDDDDGEDDGEKSIIIKISIIGLILLNIILI